MLVPLFRIFVLFIMPLLSQAAGSVEFDQDVAPLLRGEPRWEEQLRGVEFPLAGTGLRISGRVAPALAGQRVGPYEFRATEGSFGRPLRVVFHTDVRFFTEDGRLLGELRDGEWNGDDLSDAVKAAEEVTAIDVQPVS